MAKKYLVTGGAGFIGAALVKRLVRDGHEVRVLDNQSRGSAERLAEVKEEIEFIQGDIRDSETVQRATRGVESCVHLAYVNGTEFFYTKPELVLDVGVRGMINVLDACMAENVGELVLASSSEVYQTPPMIPTPETAPLSVPDPYNPRYSYGGGKIISELMAINFGRRRFERTLIFRPHNVYGPEMGWEHVIPQFVLRMKPLAKTSEEAISFPIQGSGKETRAFIYIDDFVQGLILVLTKGKHLETYHIGTMDELTVAQVAETVGLYFGKKILVEPGPGAEGGTPRRCPDISKITRLGFKPEISFSDGVFKTARWYDRNSHLAPVKQD